MEVAIALLVGAAISNLAVLVAGWVKARRDGSPHGRVNPRQL